MCRAGIGTINASVATAIGIEIYKPEAIIMDGVAGAHGKEVHKGDLVVSTEILKITSIKTPAKSEGEGSNPFDWEIKNYGIANVDMNADENLINLVRNIEGEYTEGKVFYGVIASGDMWNKEADKILDFKEKYKTLCEEMEGAAVFQVAKKYKVPVIDIRVISNNEVTGEEYERTVGVYAQKFVHKLINEYIKQRS